MQTVFLAAGEGTRMRPLTAGAPKPMLPVAGSPILEHTIDVAIDAGATEIVLVVGYYADEIQAYFGDEFRSIPIRYAVQEDRLGTAHAVQTAAHYLDDEPFVVLNGDALYDRDSLAELYGSGPAVGSFEVDTPEEYGVLELDGGRVDHVFEKPTDPPSNLVNTGAYVFPSEALSWLEVEQSERGELELTDVLERTCETYEVTPVEMSRWLDVGRPWELLEANEWKLDEQERRIDGTVHESAELVGDVVIEEGATIRSGVVIEGPGLVESGAVVGPNAFVRGASSIGEGVKVGHAVEIKNSVLMAETSVGHLSYVGDSVLGEGVNFGAGTTVANLRHDGGDVTMQVKGQTVSTGRRKFGTVCGPGAKTGINTSLNAGVTLPDGGMTKPGSTVLYDPDA
ncbi:MAG: bifunctional sugar-1-phosphate nucleotidylyltransferase/acetyltransferase [Halodesulfurarchaeum sp.]